jgi:hypothetical protein
MENFVRDSGTGTFLRTLAPPHFFDIFLGNFPAGCHAFPGSGISRLMGDPPRRNGNRREYAFVGSGDDVTVPAGDRLRTPQ